MTDSKQQEQISLHDLHMASAITALIVKDGLQANTAIRAQEIVNQSLAIHNSSAYSDVSWESTPDWATCRATDEDGTTYAYEIEPERGAFAWHSKGGQIQELEGVSYHGNWKNSLQKRGEE